MYNPLLMEKTMRRTLIILTLLAASGIALAKPVAETAAPLLLKPTADQTEAAIWAICHPDLETDIRSMSGYINPKQYGSVQAYENEIGAVERVRYMTTTIMTPWTDVGGAKGAMRSTSGTLADVYPIFYIGKNAYGIVPLKGKSAIAPMVSSIGTAGSTRCW